MKDKFEFWVLLAIEVRKTSVVIAKSAEQIYQKHDNQKRMLYPVDC